eukprot:gene7772-10558_t
MSHHRINFDGKLLILGFGGVASASIPVILQVINISTEQLHIISEDSQYWDIARKYNISYEEKALSKINFREILDKCNLTIGDIILDLTVEVSSVDLISYCQEKNILYFNTSIEIWKGEINDSTVTTGDKTAYKMRELLLENRINYDTISRSSTSNENNQLLKENNFNSSKFEVNCDLTDIDTNSEISNDTIPLHVSSTAIVGHGANPGIINHLVKRALVKLNSILDKKLAEPTRKEEWADFAYRLGVKVIQISERDSQISSIPKKDNEFINTWCIDGFIFEGVYQPSELGWGTHEKKMPVDGYCHDSGCQAAIYIDRPGASNHVRGWTPDHGPYEGLLITHNETISMADMLTIRDKTTNEVVYRPTVFYAYGPCDAAYDSIQEVFQRNNKEHELKRLIVDDVTSGSDELGCLILGDFDVGDASITGFWHGSNLSIEQTRALAPHNNATTMQVVAGVVSGLVWMLENPTVGIIEADDMDYTRVLEIADAYLGTIVDQTTSWTPIESQTTYHGAEVGIDDVNWQFDSFLV